MALCRAKLSPGNHEKRFSNSIVMSGSRGIWRDSRMEIRGYIQAKSFYRCYWLDLGKEQRKEFWCWWWLYHAWVAGHLNTIKKGRGRTPSVHAGNYVSLFGTTRFLLARFRIFGQIFFFFFLRGSQPVGESVKDSSP